MDVEKCCGEKGEDSRKQQLKAEIAQLKQQRDAVILAHFYQQGEIQDVADYIGDSLQLARIATTLPQKVVVMCGVHFMGETAKILCPEKTVLIPDADAGCSLADSCPADELKTFIEKHPGHTVVSYVNTSAAVKALTDVVVTSSNALKVVESLPKDTPVIFGPDRNLGAYINAATGRNMVLWNGACHVHSRFSVEKILQLKKQYPQAQVLAHPECPRTVLMLADKVGSTAALLGYATESEAKQFIVATESGILHEMRRRCPDKTFIPAPPDAGDDGDTSCGCNDCAYMKLNTLQKLRDCLADMRPQINVDPELARRALLPIQRMLEI